MKRWIVAMLLVPGVALAGVCPNVPERPACLPETGTFDDAADAKACLPTIQKYVWTMNRRISCEGSQTDKANDREQLSGMQKDFVDATGGSAKLGNGGVPSIPNAPAPGGSAPNGGNGMAVNTGNGTTSQQVPVIVNVGGSYGVTGTMGGYGTTNGVPNPVLYGHNR